MNVTDGKDATKVSIRSVVIGLIWGLVLAGMLVFLTGFLDLQASAQQLGAVLDLNNSVIAVTSPQIPFLPMAAMAALGFIVLYMITFGTRNGGKVSRLTVNGTFVLATALLVFCSFVVSPFQGLESDSSLMVLPGWKGWLEKGGVSPVVHLLILVSLGLVVRDLGQKAADRHYSKVFKL